MSLEATEANPDVERAAPPLSSALLLSCGSYPLSNYPAVPAAQDNLDGMAEAFKDPDLWGLTGMRLFPRLNPDRADVLDLVSTSSRLGQPEGMFVLYFFGHAERHNGTLYLAPSDADRSRPETSMVAIDEIYRTVDREAVAGRKLLILDCCFAGQAIRAVPGQPISDAGGDGWFVMAATAPTATALADPQLKTSLFTSALLEAFKGAPDGPRSLTPSWVFSRVSRLVPQAAGENASRLVPHRNTVDWGEEPWLRNRDFREPDRGQITYSVIGPTAPATPVSLPYGFRTWPEVDPLYTGRADELRQARERLRQRVVLPVRGPRYAGKAAFVREVLASPEVRSAEPTERPWLYLEITVTNASAESPVLEALAHALEIRFRDAEESMDSGRGRELVIERLKECARGHTLLLVIDCDRLGYDGLKVSKELDLLLEDPYFRDTANVVVSRVPLIVDGSEQLERQPEVRLAELSEGEASNLLTRILERGRVSVDGAAVLSTVHDRRLRLPGVLGIGARGFLDSDSRASMSPEPATVAAALLEGAAPSVARTLQELSCRITATASAPVGGGGRTLATLTVWALTDQLPLPAALLERRDVGVPRHVLRLLEDARVLSRTPDGLLEMGQASKQALRSLLIAALTRGGEVEDPLVPRPLDRELDELFPPDLEPEDLDGALSAAACALFLTALTNEGVEREGADQPILLGMRWALGWIEDEAGHRLPRLRRVLAEPLVADSGDRPFLPALQEPEASPEAVADRADDTVAGAEPPSVGQLAQAVDVTESLAAIYRLYRAVASVTSAVRAVSGHARVCADFMVAAEEFAQAVAACEPHRIPPSLLRSTDMSLAVAGRRLGLTVHLLEVRRSVAETLFGVARERGPGQAGRITLVVSWVLNTADALLDSDDVTAAEAMIQTALDLIEDLPNDGTSRTTHTRLQLRSRVAWVRSRCLADPAARRAELQTVADNAVAGLELASVEGEQMLLWTRRLIDAGVSLAQQSASDEQLLETRHLVFGALERCWGIPGLWPVQLRISLARFLRKIYARVTDVSVTCQGAAEAVRLLADLAPSPSPSPSPSAAGAGAGAPDVREESGGMPGTPVAGPVGRATGRWPEHPHVVRVLIATAQAHGFLAHCLREASRFGDARTRVLKAEACARQAVELAPNAITHTEWLRQVLDLHRSTPLGGVHAKAAEERRRSCIRTIRTWLSHESSYSREHALLDLRCLRSDWAVEGSLRSVAEQVGEDFFLLPALEKQKRINRHYHERAQRVGAHRNRYGDSIELCVLETQLEREYQRWAGILEYAVAVWHARETGAPYPKSKAPKVDNGSVFEIFERATRTWPGDHRLLRARAEFHRYVWEDLKAVDLYEHLARTARDGDSLCVAKLRAAEALLAHVQHSPALSHDKQRELLGRAQRHLAAVAGHSRFAEQEVVLRARVSLHLGEEVDWDRIDLAFNTIVGGDYAGTVGRFLDRRHYGDTSATDRLGDRLRITRRRTDSEGQKKLWAMFEEYGACGGEEPTPRTVRGVGNRAGADAPGTAGTAGDVVPGEGAPATAESPAAGREVAENVAEQLLSDFTSVELLQGLGQLYLARSEMLMSASHSGRAASEAGDRDDAAREAVTVAQRAYDCFDACRLLQKARGNESIVTKFLRGRAITLAADWSRSSDPFPWRAKRASQSLLAEGGGLLQAAVTGSVGRFRTLCNTTRRLNSRLQGELKASGL